MSGVLVMDAPVSPLEEPTITETIVVLPDEIPTQDATQQEEKSSIETEQDEWVEAKDCPRREVSMEKINKNIAHVFLQDLQEGNVEAIKAFSNSMHVLGFAFVSLESKDSSSSSSNSSPSSSSSSSETMPLWGPEAIQILENSYASSKVFFAQKEEKKKKYSMPTDRDVGYIDLPHIKEFYQMRYTNSPRQKWPRVPHDFKKQALTLHDFFQEITKICLTALAQGIEIAPEKFVSLLDPDERKEDTEHFFGSTLLRYFHYYNDNHPSVAEEDPCKIHTDIGYLTIIPVTDVPQLEFLDFESFDWFPVEPLAKRNELLILCGETMERLTAFHYKAVIHRVCPTDLGERYSLVFLCRPRPDAVLDSEGLQSAAIGPIYWDYKEPITVSEFMRTKYLSKESANGLNLGQVGSPGFPATNIITRY
jgi:isopenicillin N synthase-like dioxygenase